MKRFCSCTWMLLTMLICFTACTSDEENGDIQPGRLIGKWRSGTVYYRYDTGGNGATWDTADDVTESEAQRFTWTLVQTTLTQVHLLETGGEVPKVYTVLQLTESTLEYEDDFGKSYRFSRIQ